MTETCKGQCGSILTGSTPSDSSWPGSAKDEDRRLILAYLEDRFGITASAFDDYLMLEKNRSWWLLRRSPHLNSVQSFKVAACGMKAFQRVGQFIKPTTRAVQLFGTLATKAVVHLEESQLQCMLKGEDIFLNNSLEDGYVILAVKNHMLGLGLLIKHRLRLQIRKNDIKSLAARLDT